MFLLRVAAVKEKEVSDIRQAHSAWEALRPNIGNRVDLPQTELARLVEIEASANDVLLKNFYEQNPVVAQYVTLLANKPAVNAELSEKNTYKATLAKFYENHPEYNSADYQKKLFTEVRSIVPAGGNITVRNSAGKPVGFAELTTLGSYGRSPKGTYPVMNARSKDLVDFKHAGGHVTEEEFQDIKKQMLEHLKNKNSLYESNLHGLQGDLRIPVRTIAETPGDIAFTNNMFRNDPNVDASQLEGWTIVSAPTFKHPDASRFDNGVFKFFNYETREVLIGGTSYRGEVKKSIFNIANFELPLRGHLSMHCSSVYDPKTKDVTLVFGLSGTGKSTVGAGIEGAQTLSDDETFINLETGETGNIENGNYYKTGGLLDEPKVLAALENPKPGDYALYENVLVAPDGRVVFSVDPTDNGRVSLPLSSLPNAILGGTYPLPNKIIILSRDLLAVLDPINILTKLQTILYLFLGYTSRTAGTEAGVTKAESTFSKWEGGPFYHILDRYVIKVWLKLLDKVKIQTILMNSGEGGGPVGSDDNQRFPVAVTLKLSQAFTNGSLMKHHQEHPEDFEENVLLGTIRPKSVPESIIPKEIQRFFNAQKLWEENGYRNYSEEALKLFTTFKEKSAAAFAKVDASLKYILEEGPRIP